MPSSSSSDWSIPSDVYVYDDPSAQTLEVKEIVSYLGELLPSIDFSARGEFFQHHDGNVTDVADRIARTKVRNASRDFESFDPLPGETRFEENLLKSPERRVSGILYDAMRLQAVMRSLLPAEEVSLDRLHAAFTPRLIGSFDDGDMRYHARVILCGYPSIISTSGVVVAPAKPREFYAARQSMRAMGTDVPAEVLEERIEGRFLDYDDPRLTEVMKGYVMQAIVYSITREPFCDDPKCRLFNSHWQEEVLRAQLDKPEFCNRHAAIIESIASARSR